MNARPLGRTGLEVSEVGYGAWGIGGSQWIGAEDDESVRALERAIDLGLTFIDTALAYGAGHSERLVGQVVRGRSEPVRVATKVPPKNVTWPAATGTPADEAFPGAHVRACTERSLRNLGVDTLDLQQLHVWQDAWLDEGDWRETVADLKTEGKIRAFGISLNDHEPANGLRAVREGAVDSVQVIFNLFDQSPEDELLPACAEHGVGVLARVPFDEGALTGTIGPDSTFPPDDFRTAYFRGRRRRQVQKRVRRLVDDLGIEVVDLPEVALRWILSHDEISSVIPGMRSLRNVERNVAVGDGRGLPAEQVERLRGHRWVRNFYR